LQFLGSVFGPNALWSDFTDIPRLKIFGSDSLARLTPKTFGSDTLLTNPTLLILVFQLNSYLKFLSFVYLDLSFRDKHNTFKF
jgi:hypothetical protein